MPVAIANIKKPAPAKDVEAVLAEAPELEHVNWRSDPGLRKLYFWAFIICIASATTGYDGYAALPLPLKTLSSSNLLQFYVEQPPYSG